MIINVHSLSNHLADLFSPILRSFSLGRKSHRQAIVHAYDHKGGAKVTVLLCFNIE
jgi:hypothetical protein